METSSHDEKSGLAGVALPLLILLFWSIPWKGDPRTAPPTERFLQLRTSPWSWDQAEYKRLQDSVNFDTRIDGLPLLVALGPVADDADMFQTMVQRKADLNSSDWGCTPLLAALDADAKPDDNGRPREPVFSEILLRAGADPNLLPSTKAVDRRLATNIPRDTCGVFDARPKEQRLSILRIFVETELSAPLIELLLEKGARPRNAKDAQAILHKAMSVSQYGDLVDDLMQVTLKHGASLDDDNGSSDTPLIHAIIAARSQYGVQDVIRLLEHGADPDRRNADGELPLQFALDQCIPPRPVLSFEDDNNHLLQAYAEKDWRESDNEARARNVNTLHTIEALLKAGANPNLPMKPLGQSDSLLTYAVTHCPSDIPHALVSYKARVTQDAVKAAHLDLRHFLRQRSDQ